MKLSAFDNSARLIIQKLKIVEPVTERFFVVTKNLEALIAAVGFHFTNRTFQIFQIV
jgi:hypothetical protein